MGLRVKPADFGEIVRQEREAADLTQVELAALLGVSARTIQYWEAGHRPLARHRRLIRAWLADRDGEAA